MWTVSQMRDTSAVNQSSAAFGTVTASGTESDVLLGTERRRLPVMAPGGYRWQPRAGETVLVLKAGDNAETPCILACHSSSDSSLQPGEVELTGPGCGVKLTQNGTVCVQGTLMINGQSLNDVIHSMVSAAMSKQGG